MNGRDLHLVSSAEYCTYDLTRYDNVIRSLLMLLLWLYYDDNKGSVDRSGIWGLNALKRSRVDFAIRVCHKIGLACFIRGVFQRPNCTPTCLITIIFGVSGLVRLHKLKVCASRGGLIHGKLISKFTNSNVQVFSRNAPLFQIGF